MDTHQRILVVGGGIFGLGTAYALARRGYNHVEVLERGQLGQGSTALAAGILSLHTWNDSDARLIHRTRELLEDLVRWGQAESHPSARTAWHAVGGVTIVHRRNARVLEDMHRRMGRLHLVSEILEAAEAAQRVPVFRFEPDETALWGSTDGYVESTDVLDLLRRRGRGLGVQFRENAGVAGLRLESGRVQGIRLEGGAAERADHVIIACGARTRPLLEAAGLRLPAIPYRTQLATLEMAGSDRLPVLHDTTQHFYARPESSSRFLAGDGTQLREFDPDRFNAAADPEFVESTAARILARFRDGENVRYRNGWAGLCVGTPDRRPLAGPIAAVAGLHVLTGDNGFGLMRGLALGEVVAAGVEGRSDEDAPALRPDRFGPDPPRTFPLGEGFSLPD